MVNPVDLYISLYSEARFLPTDVLVSHVALVEEYRAEMWADMHLPTTDVMLHVYKDIIEERSHLAN